MVAQSPKSGDFLFDNILILSYVLTWLVEITWCQKMNKSRHPIATLPSKELNGVFLWQILYQAQYYDDDERMPGNVPVDELFFVLAENREEALRKARPLLKQVRKKYHENVKIEVTIATLEDFIPARNCRNESRLGYFSMSSLESIKLVLKGDKKLFRLGVCLIPTN